MYNTNCIMAINRIKCPSCGHMCNIKSDRQFGFCSVCGTRIFLDNPINITTTKVVDEPTSLEEYVLKGKELVRNNNHAKLRELAITMVGKWRHSFYPYCFLAISETGIDIINGLPFNTHTMSKFEVGDDIKSRIYHFARHKYVSSTQNVFNGLSKFYPDVPSSVNSSSWEKAPTSYEERLLTLAKYQKAIALIDEKYLSNMRDLAKNDEEYLIISNYLSWVKNVNDGLKDLKNYNDKANEFVKEDFKNTPKPSNMILFTLYISIFILSSLLVLFSVMSLILGGLFGYTSVISKIGFFICSFFIGGTVCYYLIRKKTFSSGRLLLGLLLVISSIIIITLGATGSFIAQPDNGLIIFFFIASIIISVFVSIVSFIIFYKNRPVDTNKNKTYIGDLESLLSNNFTVDFSYKFEIFK